MHLSTFPWWNSSYHIGSIRYCLLTVKGTLCHISQTPIIYVMCKSVQVNYKSTNLFVCYLLSCESLAYHSSVLANHHILSSVRVHASEAGGPQACRVKREIERCCALNRKRLEFWGMHLGQYEVNFTRTSPAALQSSKCATRQCSHFTSSCTHTPCLVCSCRDT